MKKNNLQNLISRKLLIITFLFIVILITLACGKSDTSQNDGDGAQTTSTATLTATTTFTPLPSQTPYPTNTPLATATPTSTPTATLPPANVKLDYPLGPDIEDYPAGINPMTCKPASDASLLNLPAILMSVTDWPQSARPQAGLSFAPAIYEIYIGEGMTRFLTVFYGDTPHSVPFVSGDQAVRQEPFEMTGEAAVGNLVWLDSNENGIGGIGVELLDENGDFIESTTTDTYGIYAFNAEVGQKVQLFFDLPYTFKFSPQDAADDELDSDADPNTGLTVPFTVVAGNNFTWDAGLIQIFETKAPVPDEKQGVILGDQVWYDLNKNGIQDPAEFGYPNVEVQLLDKTQQLLKTTQTDFGGYYFFDITPGDYIVRFKEPTNTGGFSPQDAGADDALDSDVNSLGWTDIITVPDSDGYELDAGLVPPPPPPVGPARSGRQAYSPFVSMFGPDTCLVAASKDPTVKVNLCSYLYGSDPDDVNSAGIDPEKLPEIAKGNQVSGIDPNYSGNVCDVTPPEGGAPANSLLAFYNAINQTLYRYDPLHGGYLRFDNRTESSSATNFVPSTDRLTGRQLVYGNLIVIEVQHIVDRAFVFDLALESREGPATVFRNGQVYQGLKWSTINEDYELETGVSRPIKIRYNDGTPFPLAPGNTWFFIANPGDPVWEPGAAGEWKFRYYPLPGIDP